MNNATATQTQPQTEAAISFQQVPFVDCDYPVWNADEAAHARLVDAMRTRLDEAETSR